MPSMTKHISFIAIALGLTLASASAEVLRKESTLPVKETIDKFETILKDKGFTIFARVDHAAGAKTVNQELRYKYRSTRVIIRPQTPGGPLTSGRPYLPVLEAFGFREGSRA